MDAKEKEARDAEIFLALREIMASVAPDLSVKDDTPTHYQLITKSASWKGQPMFFGAVMRKSYVSYHLMGVYWKPALLDGVSAPLRKRMQGKSCFHFRKMEPELFAELALLTRRCAESYREAKML